MKIGVYAAHDDDALVAVGGLLSRYSKEGNKIFYLIFTDGRASHKAVLNINKNPTEEVVKKTPKIEIKNALSFLDINSLYFLDFYDRKLEKNEKNAEDKCREITMKEKPDIIFFQFPDAHPDHRAANKIMKKIIN
ncbi:MAG: PIG-L family deacetylase, partial [bacterium]